MEDAPSPAPSHAQTCAVRCQACGANLDAPTEADLNVLLEVLGWVKKEEWTCRNCVRERGWIAVFRVVVPILLAIGAAAAFVFVWGWAL